MYQGQEEDIVDLAFGLEPEGDSIGGIFGRCVVVESPYNRGH